MENINALIAKAHKAGFEDYSAIYNRIEERDEVILTCTKGEHSGEVIDLHYIGSTVIFKSVTSQFPETHPHFKVPTFTF
jgi:hypothetical protein